MLLCYLFIINFVLLPTLWKKIKRIETYHALYRDYAEKFLRSHTDPVKRLFYDESPDCVVDATPCISDRDCAVSCGLGGKQFYCNVKSRLCLPKKNKKTKCFPHKGVIPVGLGDFQRRTTARECVSLFPALIDDNGKKLPGVCDGESSKLTINVNAHFPRIEDCSCSSDRTLVTFGGRRYGYINSSYDIPRCVLFPHLYVK